MILLTCHINFWKLCFITAKGNGVSPYKKVSYSLEFIEDEGEGNLNCEVFSILAEMNSRFKVNS